jgi:hypothetical protein
MAGLEILRNELGIVEAERFAALIQGERFDYTKWRSNLFEGLSGREISKEAIDFQRKLWRLAPGNPTINRTRVPSAEDASQ